MNKYDVFNGAYILEKNPFLKYTEVIILYILMIKILSK